jgi:hypothetical protein
MAWETQESLRNFFPIYPARMSKGKNTIKSQERQDKTVLKKTYRVARNI